jgi:DNA-3-methyladenine glycosylase II
VRRNNIDLKNYRWLKTFLLLQGYINCMIETYTAANFKKLCNRLAAQDPLFKNIIATHGYPPLWVRPASFQTLILIILEQQVSLAAAYAAFKKLKEKIGYVTPAKILALSNEDLRSCYFTRQKIVYARELATSIQTKQLVLKKLRALPDEVIRNTLKQIKGIGDWTVDVYLMHSLQRTDLFPMGDIALVNSLKHEMKLDPHTTKEILLQIAAPWRPYRTIAAMLLWHAYIKRKKIKLGV